MKFLPTLALLPILVFSAPLATAQQPAAQCLGIAGDAQRLACYDAAFAQTPVDGNDALVVFESEQLIPARPSGRDHATINVACQSGVLSVAFQFAGNLMSALGRDAGITWQFDQQPARSRTLAVNADNTAIVLDNTADSLAFIGSLEGATNLTIRVTPVNSRSLSVRYRVADFADRVAPVRGACGN